MRRAHWSPLLLAALAVLASACGSSAGGDPARPLQTSLRTLAQGAPAGDRAYWLGPEFHGSPVRFADPYWGRYAILTYRRLGDVDVDVESLKLGEPGSAAGFAVRVTRPGGQRILLVFHSPRRPGAGLIRAAEAALRPIPPDVSYPG